ncbi:MAG: Crp/Fnr family transcriptional regulator [Cyanobacteriota bacterium]
MAQPTPIPPSALAEKLIHQSYLFQGLAPSALAERLAPLDLKIETLFSNRPVYTAFLPQQNLDSLYVMLDEGLVITRTTPLDRIIALNYAGSCFGLRSLPFSYGLATRTFPCLVEAYKTAHVLKIPAPVVQEIYGESADFQERYRQLFELQQKFEYHLLNCGGYPPQAVASLLRGLIYQERELGRQPNSQGRYIFDLPVDVIARACQLNQRTVELVLKGMGQVKLIAPCKTEGDDALEILSPEGLKEVYGATREKVSWWPLR